MSSQNSMNKKKEISRKQLGHLAASMFRIGCIGFGGGSALIPVIQKAVTGEDGLVSETDFNKAVLVANITPGALPVEIASGIGRRVGGLWGMLVGASMMALPGTIFTVGLLALLHSSSEQVLRWISYLSVLVSAYIIYLLLRYVWGTYLECKEHRMRKNGCLFIALAFFMTSGKEVSQLLGLERTPIFDISTINILAVSFFIIFFTGCRWRSGRVLVSVAVALAYCLCVGKTRVISSGIVTNILRLVMFFLALYGLQHNRTEKHALSGLSLRKMGKELACWFVFLLVLTLPALVMYRGTILFVAKGLISAIMSFGGGDAYLAVADGLFVNTGMVSYEEFYSKIVTVANSMPGSILCKILSGVGYVMGHESSGSIVCGLTLALAGFACSVAASGGTFSVVACLYEQFEELPVFRSIRKYIRPIVAGLLLTVCLSMLYQMKSVILFTT